MTKQQDYPIAVAHAQVLAPPAESKRNNQQQGTGSLRMPTSDAKPMDDAQIKALQRQGFPRGLAEAMTQNNGTLLCRCNTMCSVL